jgi:hypothetical protein
MFVVNAEPMIWSAPPPRFRLPIICRGTRDADSQAAARDRHQTAGLIHGTDRSREIGDRQASAKGSSAAAHVIGTCAGVADDDPGGRVQETAALVEKPDAAGGRAESGATTAYIQYSGEKVVGARSTQARPGGRVAAELRSIDDV